MKTLSTGGLVLCIAASASALLSTGCSGQDGYDTTELMELDREQHEYEASSDDLVNYSERESVVAAEPEKAQNSYPTRHMHFDGTVSNEDAYLQFNNSAQRQAEDETTLKQFYHKWNLRTCVRTANVSNAGTDGDVHLEVLYDTDEGSKEVHHILENPGNDRVRGGLDCYEFNGINLRNLNVQYVRIVQAQLELKGTDGWLVSHFWAEMLPNRNPAAISQYVGTKIGSADKPQAFLDGWLDNSLYYQWDQSKYYIGTGYLSF